MESSHTFTVDSAVFDERNLVSAAGLVPVLELAEPKRDWHPLGPAEICRAGSGRPTATARGITQTT